MFHSHSVTKLQWPLSGFADGQLCPRTDWAMPVCPEQPPGTALSPCLVYLSRDKKKKKKCRNLPFGVLKKKGNNFLIMLNLDWPHAKKEWEIYWFNALWNACVCVCLCKAAKKVTFYTHTKNRLTDRQWAIKLSVKEKKQQANKSRFDAY